MFRTELAEERCSDNSESCGSQAALHADFMRIASETSGFRTVKVAAQTQDSVSERAYLRSGTVILWSASDVFEDIQEQVRDEMKSVGKKDANGVEKTSTEVFQKYAKPLTELMDKKDDEFAKHWPDYHRGYMHLKPLLVEPTEKFAAAIGDARKLVAKLPADQQDEVTRCLDQLAKFPDNDSDSTRFWLNRLPDTGDWKKAISDIQAADDPISGSGAVRVYRRLRQRVHEEMDLMKDLRSFSGTFLRVSGQSDAAETAARQQQLLQFTKDNFPLSEMLESPTPKLRDYEEDDYKQIEFWKK